jgi:DNA polymerase-3 subunit gamma/tau
MYQALYRKWRPQTFDEVIGQEHITETLKTQVKNGRLSHAYLFIGTRGTGKTTCARILARAVNCEHPENGNPCGRCAACRGILEGSVMDVVELDAASNNGVDNVRALREEAVYSPANVKKRVYIIDEVHMLSLQAFNALLKILEEPPEHLMFILATTELQKVPATILSRCQRHSFRRLDAGTIADYLLKIAGREGIDLQPDAASLIARLADGGVRDALSLLDQCSAKEQIDVNAVYMTVGLAGKRRIAELLDMVLRHQTEKALQLFSALWMDGKDPASLLTELNGLLRDILMLRVAPKAGTDLISGAYDLRLLESFVPRMTTEELLAAMDSVQRALAGLRDVKNPRTAAELCLISLCSDADSDSFPRLRARISRLEELIERGGSVQAPLSAQPDPAVYEPVEDSFDEAELSAFQEEQPEDLLPPLPVAPAPMEQPAPVLEAQNAPSLWEQICRTSIPTLPMDVRMSLEDAGQVSGHIDGNLLVVETPNPFISGRFQKPEVTQRLEEAAKTVCGRALRVQIRERAPEQRVARSLDELRQFREVHFISE